MGKLNLLGGTARGSYQPAKTKPVWKAAKDLKPGDTVITKDGRTATVKAVTPAEGQYTVYNFAVQDDHTYFVGEKHGVLVHNQYGVAEGEAPPTAAEGDPLAPIGLHSDTSLATATVLSRLANRVTGIVDGISELIEQSREDFKKSGQLQKLEEEYGFLSDEATSVREALYPSTILTDTERRDFNVAEETTLIKYLVRAADSEGPVDIYFGGAGDSQSEIVKRTYDINYDEHPERLPLYFQQDQGKLSLAFARRIGGARELNLIGHSYGGAAAAQLAKRLQQFDDRRVDTLIGIDPVGKVLGAHTPGDNRLDNVDYVVHVDLNGGGFFNRNNIIERAGKFGGGGIPDVFQHSADVRIAHKLDHAGFYRGFTRPDPTGSVSVASITSEGASRPLSAQDILFGDRPSK